MKEVLNILRALWYLCAGFLPAFIPLFFALAFLPASGKVLSVIGAVGLLAAAVAAPERQYSRVALSISLMLFCGLVLAAPVASAAVVEAVRFGHIDATAMMFIGPTLCTITYFVEAAACFWWRSAS